MTLILILKALLIALAGLLALAIIIAVAILAIVWWVLKGEYSLGVDADSAGLCPCPDCQNHDGTGLDCHTPAPCVERTSLLPTPNS